MKDTIKHGNAAAQKRKSQNIICKSSVFRFPSVYSLRFDNPALKCLLLLFLLCQINFAQDDLEAPPPLKILTKDEKSQLELENRVKQRTKLSLDLMDARLLKAESLSEGEDYPAMFTELGGFHALMDNTLDFLHNSDTDSGKVLNNFKRVEMTLRKYIVRLELIRRNLPMKYESYVRKLTIYVRDARSKAVEPLFADTVLPNNEPK
jgi:hypothetical protein